MERVVAITVTYNRTSTLKQCLQSLLSQTVPVEQIIVVDNNSKEEEREALKMIALQEEKIHVIWLDKNMGGAGGFEAGMAACRDRWDPDWYWLMDDDAYPRNDCLEQLLEGSRELPAAGCLAPLIYGVDLKEYQLYHHKYLSKLIYTNIPIAERYEDLKTYNRVEANAFVGPLFKRDVVNQVGIADGSLFIYGDDTEYTYRVSRISDIYMVKSAVIEHQDPPLADNYLNPSAWWKEYYSNRNRYFMVREFQNSRFMRIVAYISLTLPICKLMAAALIKPKYKNSHRLRASLLMKSVKDGLGNKRGKTLDPVKYNAYLAK